MTIEPQSGDARRAGPTLDAQVAIDVAAASEQFLEEAGRDGPLGVIAVARTRGAEDDARLISLAAETPLIEAAVAEIRPEDPDFPARVKRLAESGVVSGLYVVPRDGDELEDREFERQLAVLSEYNLSLEIETRALWQIRVFAHIAERLSGVRCILGDAGSPHLDGYGPSRERERALAAFAAVPNTICKVTPLARFADRPPAPPVLDYFQPYLDCLWEAFGAERLVFASDWPASRQFGAYTDHVALFRDYLRDDPKAAKAFFGGVAGEVYLGGA